MDQQGTETDPHDLDGSRRRFLVGSSRLAMLAGLVAGYGAFGRIAARFLYPAHAEPRQWQFVADLKRLHTGESLRYVAPTGEPVAITRRGNHRITRTPSDLRKPLALPHRIHAETNLSANDLCESIRTLLGVFSLPLTSCTIFLRQDRDA